MNFLILCPYLTRTGGPEALHQLCDALVGLGQNTRIWYTMEQDLAFLESLGENRPNPLALKISNRQEITEEYRKYRINVAESIVLNSNSIVVIPEAQVHWMRHFNSHKIIIWWLSVDNSFRSIAAGNINMNEFRREGIYHACQSKYATEFVRALGFGEPISLTDYTPPLNPRSQTKTKIAISATSKVIFDISRIASDIKSYVDIEIAFIRNLSREQVFQTFADSFAYIDLGSYPGKDRMAREAALFDCLPITLNVGGAEYSNPDLLRLQIGQLNALPQLVKHVIDNYQRYRELNEKMKSDVLAEKPQFIKEVSSLISILRHT
jgi:hypothetical protein